jgi:DNA-binding response OmpR family regulator
VLRVLFVDDQLDICDLVALFLRERGFATTTAGHGSTARHLLAGETFDVLILDAVLPDECGLELANFAHARGIPVLLVSGEPNAIRRNDQGERYPLLPKPFHLFELEAALRRVLHGETMPRPPLVEQPR